MSLEERLEQAEKLVGGMEAREARQVTGRTINVDTRFDADVIESSISGPDVMGEVVRGVIKLQDQGVRDALKALGWSDPRETADLLAITQGQREEMARRPRVGSCVWVSLDSDMDTRIWSTGCKQEWIFHAGSPQENGVKFCPHCGAEAEIQEPQD